MPPLETSDLFQTAVLWAKVSYDAYGEPTVAAPVEVQVRWEKGHRESRDPQNNVISFDATVVLPYQVAEGSIMWLGELADFMGTGSGEPDTELMEVMDFRVTPDLKNRATRFVAGLNRYKGTLPRS